MQSDDSHSTTGPATIRRADERDFAAVRALYALLQNAHANHHPQVFASPGESELTTLEFRLTLQATDVLALVAERDGEVVAAVRAALIYHSGSVELRARRTAYVTHLITRPDARRIGLGRALMGAVAAWARENEAERIELCVWEGSTEADAFYRALGYRTIAQHLALRP